jgi:hypothetical protein
MVLEKVFFEMTVRRSNPKPRRRSTGGESLTQFPDIKIQVTGHTDKHGVRRAQPEAVGCSCERRA